jgi:hypothetical protein
MSVARSRSLSPSRSIRARSAAIRQLDQRLEDLGVHALGRFVRADSVGAALDRPMLTRSSSSLPIDTGSHSVSDALAPSS